MKWAIFYTILAVVLAIAGITTKEFYWFIGAVVVALCSFYWIWKEWKRK